MQLKSLKIGEKLPVCLLFRAAWVLESAVRPWRVQWLLPEE